MSDYNSKYTGAEIEAMLEKAANNYPVVTINGTSQAMQPNTYYKFSGSSLSVSLATPTRTDIVNEYVLEVEVSDTTLSLPSSITWADGTAPEFESGYIYVISIVNDLAVYAAFPTE